MQKLKTDKMLSQLGRLNDEQFKVLFFIYNSINLNSDHTNRVKIYRAVLADLTGKSERTISRITDILEEKGLIIKDSVSDGTKLYNYYGIPKQKTEGNLVTDDRVKVLERTKSTKRTEKNLKEQKEEMRREFETACSEEMETEFENEVGISNDDFNWNDEIKRFKARVNKTKTKEELKGISIDFHKKMNDFNFPIELEDELDGIKKAVNSKMYSLSI